MLVEWVDVEDVTSPDDDLRLQGFFNGAARFARGEGIWNGNGAFYFACTSGGSEKIGQIWRYKPSYDEGTSRESQSPGKLELFIMNLETRISIQLTDNGAANFGPYWHPDGRHIIFSSNMQDPQGRNFDLYTINIDNRAIERITHYDGFDGFPMFSHDGRQLVFASNRHGKVRGETNVFIADFVP
jgi:Tol biopolymer transport system component